MGEPDGELDVLAAELRAVADPLDVEPLLEPLGHALDHVRDQAAGEPVEGAVLAPVGRALDDNHAVAVLLRLLDFELARDALLELAARALHAYELGLDEDVHAGRPGDRLLPDAPNGPTCQA